jgi:hypothetical protein
MNNYQSVRLSFLAKPIRFFPPLFVPWHYDINHKLSMGYTTHTPSGFTIDVTPELTRSTPHQHRTNTSQTPHHRHYR